MCSLTPDTSRLHLVITEAGTQSPLARLLALQRSEEPEVEVSVSEAHLDEQTQGLLTGLYDVGLAMSGEENCGLTAEPIWQEPLALAVPARSPLLTYTHVPLRGGAALSDGAVASDSLRGNPSTNRPHS